MREEEVEGAIRESIDEARGLSLPTGCGHGNVECRRGSIVALGRNGMDGVSDRVTSHVSLCLRQDTITEGEGEKEGRRVNS